MSQEIIKKFGPVLNSIDTNMIMQSSFLESMYNIAAESERRATSLLTKILNVLDGQKNAMMTNVSRDTIAKEYSFVKSNLKNIFQEQSKESNNRVNQLFTNYSSELLNAMTVNNENLSEMVSKAISTIDNNDLLSIKSSTDNTVSDSSDVLTNVTSDISSSLSNISTDLTNVSSDVLSNVSSSLPNATSDISSSLTNVSSDVLSNVSEMSNDTSKNILSLTESLSELGFIQSEQNNNSFNSQEISRLLTERASIGDGESDEITESYSYQQLIYEENVRQTSLLERLVGIGEQRLENYEDAERRRLLSDPPSNQDDDSQNQDGEDDTENKREKPTLGTIGKWIAGIGALVLASPFILGFIEGFFGKKIGELIDAMKQKALEFLSDPKVLLGIAALVGALGLLLRPISTLITGFKLLRGMLKLGGKAITGLGKMLGKLNLGKMFKNAFKGFGNFFKGSLGKITDMFKGSVGKISTLGASVADSVKSAGKSVANRLKNVKTAGGKGLLGGLFGALAGTSAATATTTTPNRTPALDSTDDARARATQNAVDDLKTTPKPKAKPSALDSTDDARARATQNAVDDLGTTASKAKTSVSDSTDKMPNVQTDVDKTQPPVVPDSPVLNQPTTDVSPNRATTSPIPGQVTTDGLPTVSDASRVPPIDEAKAAKSFLKSSAKYGIKLVPVVGAIAGALFAAGRLIEGDHVGAAMEAGGVLAPSFIGGATIDIAILARDMYKAYYGTNPETDDPELVKQRMILLKEYIERKMSSVGAAKISQEDQYMSSDAAMITPGKAVGLGGVTVNTAPVGGYESSTAMALSQTEINRIRKVQGLPPLSPDKEAEDQIYSNVMKEDRDDANVDSFMNSAVAEEEAIQRQKSKLAEDQIYSNVMQEVRGESPTPSIEPNTTEIVGDNTTNVNTTNQSSTSEISASQKRASSQAAAKLKQAFGVDRSTIINSSTEQLKQMAAEYGGQSWFDTWTKNNVMKYFNTVIEGSPKNAEIVPPTSKDTNLGKKVDQMSSESSAMQSRGAPVVVRGGDNMMRGGDVIKGGDTTIINNTVIESENFRNHIPT